MPDVKSRREMYSEATRTALLDAATELFAARGYSATSLEDVAAASQVTRGAVYHHFASKQALFEAVLEAQELRADAEIVQSAAAAADPWEAAALATGAFLDKCCDPVYGRLTWLEGPAALGWPRWRELEEKHSYGIVNGFVRALADAGYLDEGAVEITTKFGFWMLGGAGLALAEASAAEKRRVRDQWAELIRKAMTGVLGGGSRGDENLVVPSQGLARD